MPPECRHIDHGQGMGQAIAGAPRMAFRISALLLAGALALPQSAAAALEPQQVFTADYAISFFGFTVARSTVVSRFGATSYTVDGSIKSAGLAAFFDSTTAQTTVSGKIGQAGVSPDRYSVDYVYGKKAKKTALLFAKGNVVKIANSPPLPPRRADWVPVGAEGIAGRRRSDQRHADRGQGRSLRVRAHDQGLRRRDPRRPRAQLCQHGAAVDRRNRGSRPSPARAGSSRSPATIAATGRFNTCRAKARSC